MAKKQNSSSPTRFKKIWAWLDNHILFVLSAFLLAFIPLYPKLPLFDILPGYIVRVRFEDIIIAFSGFVWLVQLWRKKITWQSPLLRMIGIYTAIGFFSIVSAIFITHTVPLELLHLGKSALHLLRYIEYFFLFVMMYSALKTAKQAKVILMTVVLSVLAISIYGVGQKYWYWPVYSTMNREFSKGMRLYLTEHARVQSTFGGHYDLGAYLVIILPILLALTYKAQVKWEKRLLFLTHTFGLWLLIVSASRAPFAAYTVAALLVIVLISYNEPTWKKRLFSFLKRSIGFVFFLSFLLVIFGEDINERFMQVVESHPQYPKVMATYDYWNARRKDVRDVVYDRLGIRKLAPPPNSVAFDNSNELEPVLTPTDQLPTTVRPSDVYEDIPDLVEVETDQGVVVVEKERTWSANALKYGLSVAIRLDTLWPNAIKGFVRNPLLGSGYATLNKEAVHQFTDADSTDNNYLRALGETGLLGFLTFFGTIFLVLRLTAKHLFDKNLLKATLAIGVFAGSIGLLLNALYIDVYAASKVAFTYWAVVGVTLAVFSLKLTVPKRQQPQALLK
ncbi:MAG: Secreted polysaccharide polymerase [Candidatus Pacebacteria bacterium GW2011_GWB1_47_8]|nr:MAG: Secreted polysaccharide polymerase [Candidatus Pacebacteria bacterium GW2011_GWA1_46_10]KKU84427.1 MAG: Secreted polysaccharide polymerase [Candidatus Pacebacteria bacterium GW2011_GWB1_47_8]HCR81141.1 hypothetical protein [Candidatus Paceibacterota bacterium]